ncbi:N-acyl homoserine lactonase family protein [Azorhizobium oxalatiphilum]|uniref:N-acyl homoserine lactonase family protein n=1 Tax=Azorhizobium oxalatiphilum TaxID=980631 RepID=A0A917BPK7_9HYPH|nr:N-acyl homoserine lactonase family protein [Azorhizobium oxalatiphilum]GGF51330.1 N-acyl homoserine lactonase family protein [Azorhizobium oxalatiphilum]
MSRPEATSSQAKPYQIYAIRYATNTKRRRGQNFILEAQPDALLTMDFFSWALVGEDRTIIIDTGMERARAERNGHTFLREPADGLRAIGIDPQAQTQVVLTHAHYDHIGNVDQYPNAEFLMPLAEMQAVVGPDMHHAWMRHAYAGEEIGRLVQYLHAGRLRLHDADHEVAPGVSIHVVGGHTAGQAIVRVLTARGWVVLASDALHYYEEYERGVPFAVAHSVSDMMRAHDRIRDLADSDDHVLPAHDPLLLQKYPAARPDLDGFVLRLDVPPRGIASIQAA